MSISTFKLYKKLSNELKFKYSELDYVDQACVEGNMEFETHYRDFCTKHNISIADLEAQQPEKVKQFSDKPTITKEQKEEEVKAELTDEQVRKKKIFQRIFRYMSSGLGRTFLCGMQGYAVLSSDSAGILRK